MQNSGKTGHVPPPVAFAPSLKQGYENTQKPVSADGVLSAWPENRGQLREGS